MKKFHTHKTESGTLIKCYHQSKATLLSFSFWLGLTLGFPLEHWLWEKTPLNIITKWMGL